MSKLFSSLQVGPLTLTNRIVVAPMCQYSAKDGLAQAWHHQHLGNLAQSGAGLLIVEASAVAPEGRISHADVGIWNDNQANALAQVVADIRAYSSMPLGIQLAHAGRKASQQRPWEGGKTIPAGEPNGWATVAPSAIPFAADDPTPHALTPQQIETLVDQFAAAAKRAVSAGFELIEIHAAHGYLLHEFLSPLSNQRTDTYGGSLESRMRLPLAIFDAIAAAIPDTVALGVRISGTDWAEGGWDIDQSIALAQALDRRGCHYIHVSSAGLTPTQQIPIAPLYQVPLAEAIKAQVRMPTIAVGLITEPEQAEGVLQENRADAVALARGILYDPRWPWHAAAKLGAKVHGAPQYLRSAPHGLKDLLIPDRPKQPA